MAPKNQLTRKKETATVRRRGERTAAATAAAPPVHDGGVPVGATSPSESQQEMEERLEAQRDAAEERAQLAAARRTDVDTDDVRGIFTAVCKNGLSHRRCGIIFGAEPVTADTSDWTNEEIERFFSDSLLMIVPGRLAGARGALLSPAQGFPAVLSGGNSENATPEMLAAAKQGRAMAHPASGSAMPVVGANVAPAVRDLEREINRKTAKE